MRFINIRLPLLFITIFSYNAVQITHAQATATPPKGDSPPTDSITLYLTFDDGIVNGSRALLSIADSLQVPLNVFLIGKFVLKTDSTRMVWKAMQDSRWIQAGNHSYSHANSKYHLYYNDPLQVLQDFRMNEDSLGLTNRIARLPGRNAWRAGKLSRNDLEDCIAAADTLAANGYILIGWDLEWNYSGTDLSMETEYDLIFRIRQAVRYQRTISPKHVVILCHDPALELPANRTRIIAFITKARSAGKFRFAFLSNYPGLDQ